MLYTAYELNRLAGAPLVAGSRALAEGLAALPAPLVRAPGVRRARAFCQVLSRCRPTHVRPDYRLDEVSCAGSLVQVRERVLWRSPFATLLRFEKQVPERGPRVLVVGPISGHFTTLIAPALRTMLQDHDVHVLDWHNARDIPAEHGPFGLDEYIDHVMQALRLLGPGTHVAAVCQPAVPVLAALSLLAAHGDAAQPDSATLIAGPVDTRVNPNRMNHLAVTRPLSYYQQLTTTVPARYRGAGRRVYPGFLQLAAFMSMNLGRHVRAHYGLYRDLVEGNDDRAAATSAFYDEYGAVADVPAEFYLDTVHRVFQAHLLPRGELTWRGEAVDPAAIQHTALLTVEGENDDLCSPGQTRAALDLCTGLPANLKQHHLQPGVGHYGVFSGSRWEREIYPVLRDFISTHDRAGTRQPSATPSLVAVT